MNYKLDFINYSVLFDMMRQLVYPADHGFVNAYACNTRLIILMLLKFEDFSSICQIIHIVFFIDILK